MNVAFFSNQFADAQGHGIARYARELHRALDRSVPNIQVNPVAAWSSLGQEDLARYKHDTGLQILSPGRRLTPLAWTFLNSPPLESMLETPTDLVHAVSMGYPIATRKPLVVTVHDLGPLMHPDYFTRASPWIMRRSLNQTLSCAARIICVSQATADELLDYAGASIGARVEVVHEGVSPLFLEPCAESAVLEGDVPPGDEPYILCTGKISPRKNVAGVIRAFAELADSIPHHLVLAGGDGWNMKEVHGLANIRGLSHRIHFPGFVTDVQLKRLYTGASAYVHPSLYEGFGLTVLEAMACGCPVITSNRSSLPEVAGDAALLVDPTETTAIARAIKEICTNTQLADDLKLQGRKRAERFDWSHCADATAEVYRSALS